jgi:hypothetical protein
MRFAFLDEGGISHDEPVAVVGGVFVHGDEQVIPLEEHLEELIEKHIPKESRDGFVFHATDIWSGKKFFRDHEEWPWSRRSAILDDLALIPSKFEIPIVYETFRKKQLDLSAYVKTPSKREVAIMTHATAFSHCALRIEEFMREVWQGEIAQLVVEDNGQARAAIKQFYEFLKHPERLSDLGEVPSRFLPLKRIRGAVHFAEKTESKPLQLADFCTFMIRRRLTKHDVRCARFYDKIRPMMLFYPRSDGPQARWPFGPLG